MGVIAHWRQGYKTEAILIGKLSELGYEVLKPLNGSLRYDLVIEDGDGQFWRVQCKTAWTDKRTGTLRFNTSSSGGAAQTGKHGYQGQIDYFGVYAPETGHCFLIPISAVENKSDMRLRLTPAKNKQQKGTHDAYQFMI